MLDRQNSFTLRSQLALRLSNVLPRQLQAEHWPAMERAAQLLPKLPQLIPLLFCHINKHLHMHRHLSQDCRAFKHISFSPTQSISD